MPGYFGHHILTVISSNSFRLGWSNIPLERISICLWHMEYLEYYWGQIQLGTTLYFKAWVSYISGKCNILSEGWATTYNVEMEPFWMLAYLRKALMLDSLCCIYLDLWFVLLSSYEVIKTIFWLENIHRAKVTSNTHLSF